MSDEETIKDKRIKKLEEEVRYLHKRNGALENKLKTIRKVTVND